MTSLEVTRSAFIHKPSWLLLAWLPGVLNTERIIIGQKRRRISLQISTWHNCYKLFYRQNHLIIKWGLAYRQKNSIITTFTDFMVCVIIVKYCWSIMIDKQKYITILKYQSTIYLISITLFYLNCKKPCINMILIFFWLLNPNNLVTYINSDVSITQIGCNFNFYLEKTIKIFS